MKKYQIIFWVTAGLIFLTQGLMPILTVNAPEAKEAMAHLGYPTYFGLMLAIFKLLGGLAIVIPQIPNRVKEWAFAGFAIDFICAFISFVAVDGLTAVSLIPLAAIIILVVCYIAHHKKAA
jgi:uncharacterized membrane protein YphA (DoxX/SURF4 family)